MGSVHYTKTALYQSLMFFRYMIQRALVRVVSLEPAKLALIAIPVKEQQDFTEVYNVYCLLIVSFGTVDKLKCPKVIRLKMKIELKENRWLCTLLSSNLVGERKRH